MYRKLVEQHQIYTTFLNPDAHCCHIGTAIKHPVPDWVKPSFVFFDIRTLWC